MPRSRPPRRCPAGTARSWRRRPSPGSLAQQPARRANVYLDFNGNGQYTPLRHRPRPHPLRPREQAEITLAWSTCPRTSRPFNVNVTTIKPGGPTAWGLMTNSLNGNVGRSYVGVFPNDMNQGPPSWNPATDAVNRQSGTRTSWGTTSACCTRPTSTRLGNLTSEYSSGYDATHGPIMGVDYAKSVHKWFIGHPNDNPSRLQDDVAIIAGRIAAQPGGGDGFRPDDVGNTLSTRGRCRPATACRPPPASSSG